MNVGVNFLREHTIEKARIHYVITKGGGAPNVVPDDAEVWYFVRAPERDQVEELTDRVRRIAEGAALMTETTVTEEFISGAYNLLPNMTITHHMDQVLRELGPIPFDDEDYAYAKAVAAQYPESARASALSKRKLPESIVNDGLSAEPWPIHDEGELGSGSTDVADVSWIAPTGQIRTTCFALGVPGHSWANTATGGVGIGLKGMIHAAKGMAIAAADFILDPALLQAAKDEFAQLTAGRPYKCPIPDHVQPRKP
jgi:aminobenzoyl-glutamate utilization protein B